MPVQGMLLPDIAREDKYGRLKSDISQQIYGTMK